MKKLLFFVWNQRIMLCAMAVALALVVLSFLSFRIQVNSYIDADMITQIEAIQKSSTQHIQNEMNYLMHLTASMAQMAARTDISTKEDILIALQEYAETANVVRTLFITLDGHAYTNYGGYMGQNAENTTIDGIPLSELTEPIFTQPYYAEELDEIIFGVVSPTTMGGTRGVLVSSCDIQQFSKLLESTFIGGFAEVGILSGKGEVILGKSTDEFNLNVLDALSHVEFLDSSADEMRTNFANGASGLAVYRVNGVSRYCSYAPIGLNNWYTIVTVKESSLRGKLSNLERYGFQLTIEVVTVMLALLGIIIANRMREQKKVRLILQQAAMTDGLTGIYNRRTTEAEIERCFQSAEAGTVCALLVIDVDEFKQINDQWGHLLGDAALRACAELLEHLFGDIGIIGRIGGDEFVVFLSDGQSVELIERKVGHLIHHFSVQTKTGARVKVSVSVGVAQAALAGASFLALYQQADAALYRAKQAGRGRMSF